MKGNIRLIERLPKNYLKQNLKTFFKQNLKTIYSWMDETSGRKISICEVKPEVKQTTSATKKVKKKFLRKTHFEVI